MKIKKLILTLLCYSLIFTACNFGNEHSNKSRVFINLRDSATSSRAINPDNGLPFMKDMQVKIKAVDLKTGKKIVNELGKNPESISIALYVGHEYKITVSLSSEFGIWSGSEPLTVGKEDNFLSVKIKKIAAGFTNLGFSLRKNLKADTSYTYKIKFPSGKELNIADGNFKLYDDLDPVIFCRDTKGRLYIADSNKTIYRYDSEGENEEKHDIDTETTEKELDPAQWLSDLACDRVTGAVYAMTSAGSLKKIDDSSLKIQKVIGSGGDYKSRLLAVHNNIVFSIPRNIGLRINICKVKGDGKLSPISTPNVGDFGFGGKFFGIMDCDYPISGNADAHDIFVTDEALYILVSDQGETTTGNKHLVNIDTEITVGSLIKFNYSITGNKIEFTAPKVLGSGKFYKKPPHEIPSDEYYKNHFYKPVRFIGFDGDSLYIADDGIKKEFIMGEVKTTANKNRIVKFSLDDDSLEFDYAESDNTWRTEESPYKNIDEEFLMLFSKAKWAYPNLFDYPECVISQNGGDAIVFKPEPLSNGTLLIASETFCYNDDGSNLYMITHSFLDGNISSAYIQVYKKTNTSYEFQKMLKIPFGIFDYTNAGYNPIKGIAVDETNKRIYCATSKKLCRFDWGGTSNLEFDKAEKVENYIYEAPTGTEFTALAANADGLFLAVKETVSVDYTLKIEKYSHDIPTTLGALTKKATISFNPSLIENAGEKTNEIISDMQIKNAKLYAITNKFMYKLSPGSTSVYETIKFDGKLYKAFDTTSTSDMKISDIGIAWENTDPSKTYAPYRFITCKDKELAIASDAAFPWIDKNEKSTSAKKYYKCEQRNKVLIFTLNDDYSVNFSEEIDVANIEFGRKAKPYYNTTPHDTTGFTWE